MSDFEKALKHIDVPEGMPKEKDWSMFSEEDSFNPGNKIEGYLCHIPTRFYGALLLTRVNEIETAQLIFCTPKLHYPFDQSDHWHFPKAVRIEVFEKLDGTNIFAYVYYHENMPFQTFKTRQTPIIHDSKLLPFKQLLLEVVDRKATWSFWQKTKHNLSFELWGAKNPHLIQYQQPLTLSFLFSLDSSGNVFSPRSGNLWSGEMAKYFGDVSGNYVETYKWQKRIDNETLKPLEEGGFIGIEGRVWYLLTEEMKWIMFKCKPEQIEHIHWAFGGIGNNIIRATAFNTLEEGELNAESVIKLLKEEFTEQQIEKSLIRIDHIVAEVKDYLAFKDEILKVYDANGLDINTDKQATMRDMSKHFNGKLMSRVYNVLVAHRRKRDTVQ